MERFARRFNDAPDLVSGGGVDDDTLGEKYARIETSQVLQAEKPRVVDVPDEEADFVHVRRDQDRWPATSPLRRDQVAKAIDASLVHQRRELGVDDAADIVLEARNPGGGGEFPKKIEIHPRELSSRTML
jgi:hypothetical protein